jgi:hypothetical protein
MDISQQSNGWYAIYNGKIEKIPGNDVSKAFISAAINEKSHEIGWSSWFSFFYKYIPREDFTYDHIKALTSALKKGDKDDVDFLVFNHNLDKLSRGVEN